MTAPNPFRNALQVSHERIAGLNDAELSELMRGLLRAEAHRCRSPKWSVNTRDKASDDGCDGWTETPELDGFWLGRAPTCWQFKSGVAGERARLKGEILKPIPAQTLRAGGRFVLVASRCTDGVKGERSRLEALREEASNAGLPTDNIVVLTSETLSNWCNQVPAVAARWAGRSEGLWTLEDWSAADVHQVAFHASDSLRTILQKQRADLDFESGSVLHLHVSGGPGVGKTRFALELCRDAPWAGEVIYVQQASDWRMNELIDSAAVEADVRLVVVADEVQSTQLTPLRDSVGRGNGRIRLITVGHCGTPDSSRIPQCSVQPLSPELAARVVRGWYPSMPREHVDFVVRFADGYVRLVKLAADAVAKDAAIEVRKLLGRGEIRGFLDGMLGPGDRGALYVVAVLSHVGWTDGVGQEGQAIAHHFGMDWNAVRAKLEAFDRSFGIVPRGGRYRYVSPTPLGTHLAVEAWETYPELLRTLPSSLPSEEAKDAYYERLRSIASNPATRTYAREELDHFFRLPDFMDARAVRRWSALSAADPEKAARHFMHALSNTTIADRRGIAGGARREIVWTLVRLAWRRGAFPDATTALALLAEAENETWANNASAEFKARYQLRLSGTSVPYLDRLPVLDSLLKENRPGLSRLVIGALARAFARYNTRVGSAAASDELPEQEWRPTDEEVSHCKEGALQRLSSFAEKGLPEVRDDLVAVAKDLALLLREPSDRSAIEVFLDVVRQAYPETREDLRRAIYDVLQLERKQWKELAAEDLAALEAIHERFVDTALDARLRQFVGQPSWDPDDVPDLRPLAKEILNTPGALAAVWAWLTSGEAGDAWRLGQAFAEEDPDRVLLSGTVALAGNDSDSRLLCAYVGAWRAKLGDPWYEQWFESLTREHPRPARLLLEASWRCGVTPPIASVLADVIRTEQLPPPVVGQLTFGTWAEKLPFDTLKEILQSLVDAGYHETALAILQNRTKKAPAELDGWRGMALQLVTRPSLIRSFHMTAYYWKELALTLVSENPGEIATAVLAQHGLRSGDTWMIEHSEASTVLAECVKRKPLRVWEAMLPYLSEPRYASLFIIGFPRGLVDLVPADAVLSWVTERPEDRAPILARLVHTSFSSDESLAARILALHGDNRDVRSAFLGEYLSGSWSGPASLHWERLASRLDDVGRRTQLPALREWTADASRELRGMAERERQREAEEDLRGV